MHFGFTNKELERRNKSEKSIEMVTVEVRYEDVLDAGEFSIGIAESDLGSLSTIDEEQMTAHFEQLCRRAGVGARGRTVTTQDSYFHKSRSISSSSIRSYASWRVGAICRVSSKSSSAKARCTTTTDL